MDLNLNEFVLVVLAGSLLLTAAVSVLSRLLHVKAESRLSRARAVCRICGHVFVFPHSVKISRCPACDKPNLRRGNGRLG